MLTDSDDFLTIAEVNPPALPDASHCRLSGAWSHILITDNVFGTIRVSPYAYGARIAHDVPGVHPSIVVSTRDRNVLAIESEVRGALGNGVDSFLVVPGDTYPKVDHLADRYQAAEHLRALQDAMPAFEVGMPTRFGRRHLQRQIDGGAQFVVTSPVLDPEAAREGVTQLELRAGDPPVYLAIVPPFGPSWIARARSWGAVATPGLARRAEEVVGAARRRWAWTQVSCIRDLARDRNVAGVILMGLKFETLVGEAAVAIGACRARRGGEA